MSRVIDAVIAYRVLKLLVTPFDKTKAFELGIIDDKGKVLIKSRNIETAEQRNAYTPVSYTHLTLPTKRIV